MEKDEDIIVILADDDNDMAAPEFNENKKTYFSLKQYFAPAKNAAANFFKELPRPFLIGSAAVCAAVIIAAPIAGYKIPKSEQAVQKALASLEKKDTEYIAASSEGGEAAEKSEKLQLELSDKQAQLDEFRQSKDNLDKIYESNAALQAEKEDLEKSVVEKQAALNKLDESAASFKNRILTWTSGDYSVGRDISAGRYVITGSGSIAVANSGKSIYNGMLSSEGRAFSLNAGDNVRIEGRAQLTPQ